MPSGVLDLDTVWQVLLRAQLGFDDGRPDALAVLRWGTDARNAERYRALQPPDFRDAVRRRLEETAGQVAVVMLDALEVAPGTDLLAMGLAARALFSEPESPVLRSAAVRFERYHRQHDLPSQVGLRWAEAAERLIGEMHRDRGGE